MLCGSSSSPDSVLPSHFLVAAIALALRTPTRRAWAGCRANAGPVTISPSRLLVLGAALFVVSFFTMWWGYGRADRLPALYWFLGYYVMWAAVALDLLALLWLGLRQVRRRGLPRRHAGDTG